MYGGEESGSKQSHHFLPTDVCASSSVHDDVKVVA